jgi:hypothetical protein
MADNGDSTDSAQTASGVRRRPSIAPMASSDTAAPMRTRPPMTPLPPLAPKPPPPPEAVEAPVKKKGRRAGLWLFLFALLAAASAGAYYKFMLQP